jgi:hypothetical protein
MVQGKYGEAVEWALKVAKYFNDKDSGMRVRVLRNINGPWNEIHWSVRFESIAAMGESRASWPTDEGYQALLAETEGMFEPLVVDNFYEAVE